MTGFFENVHAIIWHGVAGIAVVAIYDERAKELAEEKAKKIGKRLSPQKPTMFRNIQRRDARFFPFEEQQPK